MSRLALGESRAAQEAMSASVAELEAGRVIIGREGPKPVLVAAVLQNQHRQLELMERIDEIQGLLVDLIT